MSDVNEIKKDLEKKYDHPFICGYLNILAKGGSKKAQEIGVRVRGMTVRWYPGSAPSNSGYQKFFIEPKCSYYRGGYTGGDTGICGKPGKSVCRACETDGGNV